MRGYGVSECVQVFMSVCVGVCVSVSEYVLVLMGVCVCVGG